MSSINVTKIKLDIRTGRIKIGTVRFAVQLSVLLLMFAGILKMGSWLIIAAFIAAVFFGPVFCGWICPFGFIQEMIGELGKKARKKLGVSLPSPHGVFKYLRYAVLGVEIVLVICVLQNQIVISDTVKYAFLGMVLVMNLFSQRFLCKYFCPLGAVLSITNLFKVFAVKKESGCPNCGACTNKCMMGVDLAENGGNRDIACISCFKCVDSCSGSKDYLHF